MTHSESNRPTEFTMSSVTGKLILAMVRESDYAHAGEEEAIDLVLERLTLSQTSRVLDVGCGIGGTAHYVQRRGWGTVTGVDLDADNIELARARHPGLDFFASDAAVLDQVVQGPFDAIYLFNAFFLFGDQPTALDAMRAVATPNTQLAIFDYVDLGGYSDWQKHRATVGLRNVLNLEGMPDLLGEHGWELTHVEHHHADYLRWYGTLVSRIESLRAPIIERSSEGFFNYVLARYSETLDDVRAGRLGGSTFYATSS